MNHDIMFWAIYVLLWAIYVLLWAIYFKIPRK